MGHLYHGYVTNNQRVNLGGKFHPIEKPWWNRKLQIKKVNLSLRQAFPDELRSEKGESADNSSIKAHRILGAGI